MKKDIPIKTIAAGAIGGAIEFYDFTLYGILAPLFAIYYFPSEQKHWAIISAYLVFAIGFIARPIGSIIFGHIGDLYGRKTALCWSLFCMAIATLTIGSLPTYASIGFFAPLFMVLARIMQGISAGGEYSGALILAIEHSNKNRTGLTGGLVVSGCMAGLVLGSIAGAICLLPNMPSWCWRVPFLLGFLVSLVGIYIRLHLTESINLTKVVKKVDYTKKLNDIIPVIFIAGFNGIALYLYFIFFSTFMTRVSNTTALSSQLVTCLGTVLLMFMLILFGWLSDSVGRMRLIKIGNILTVMMALILFLSPYSQSSYFYNITVQLLFIVAFGMYSGPLNTFIIELFNKSVRYRCASISYSIGMGFIGGSAPLIASILSLSTKNTYLLASYIVVAGAIAYISLLYLDKKRDDHVLIPLRT